MADAAVVMTVNPYPNGVDTTQRRVKIYGTAAITANGGTSPSTGLPLSWSTLIDGNFGSGTFIIPQVGPVQAAAGPANAEFESTGNATATQTYRYDPTNDSLVVYAAGAPIETGIAADTLSFEAEFIKDGF